MQIWSIKGLMIFGKFSGIVRNLIICTILTLITASGSVRKKDIFHDVQYFYALSGAPINPPDVFVNGILQEEGADYYIVSFGVPARFYLTFIAPDMTKPLTIQVIYESPV